MALTCTPAARLSQLSCLSCLSDSELDKAFVVALASNFSGYTLPAQASNLVSDSACFTCLSDKQLKQAMVSAYFQWGASPNITIEEIRNRLKCLQCANPKQVKAMISFLTCRIIEVEQTPLP